MKSYFSRFLYNTLSHFGIREVFTSSLSLSDLIGESMSNKFANLSHLDYRVKPDNDSICTGRSMVEMLGVLAIIGVLSVGAIAGYSKAMSKYKLNKQAEQISWLLNAMYRYKDLLGQTTHRESFVPYLIKLGEIPQEMIKDNTTTLYDAFGLHYGIYTNGGSPNNYANLHINITDTYQNFDICNNIIETSKAFAEQLTLINFWQTNDDDTNTSLYIFGNKYCYNNSQCLKNLSKNDIYNICQLCADKKGCSFNIQYKIKD